ncbi:MAG: T9SS type A sorting domain-containing protein, partial [Bacteroidales bacterium]
DSSPHSPTISYRHPLATMQKKIKVKKQLFVLIIFLSTLTLTSGQGLSWLWARRAGGIYNDHARSISSDAAGNVYITGGFQSPTITFDYYTLVNFGGEDIFIAKYDPMGDIIWLTIAAGTNYDYVNSISVDDYGNSIITGSFQSPGICFDTILLYCSHYDLFVAKYNTDGAALWAKRAPNVYNGCDFICTDHFGNCYVTGAFFSYFTIFGNDTLMNDGINFQFFIVKYDTDGNILWSKSAGGGDDDCATGISTDPEGNIYITGYFRSPFITFDSITLTNAGNADIFVVKYNANGEVIWAKSVNGAGDDISNSISTDANGNSFITGTFKSSVLSFDSASLTSNHTLTTDIFVVKYDVNGNVKWAKCSGGSDNDYGNSVSATVNGNVVVTGSFFSTILTFDSIALNNCSSGSGDIFLVEYDAVGNVLWATSVPAVWDNFAYGVNTDNFGNVYIVGSYNSLSISFGTTTFSNSGLFDLYLAKLSTTTGIEESNLEKIFFIYPNPCSIQTTLLTNEILKNATLTIYNSFGQQVKLLNNISGQTIILLRENLPNGMYFLQLTQDNKSFMTEKLLITDN